MDNGNCNTQYNSNCEDKGSLRVCTVYKLINDDATLSESEMVYKVRICYCTDCAALFQWLYT